MKKGILLLISCFYLSLGYSQTYTFTYTGGLQTWTVPSGVTSITVDAQGAKGAGVAGYSYGYQSVGGCGGRVQATLAVTPGDVLNIVVGGQGSYTTGAGGYGGGGSDGYWTSAWPGAGGGGESNIKDGTASLDLLHAGGGGGGGGDISPYDPGGAGGGLTGANGGSNICSTTGGGRGGTAGAGGAGGTCYSYTGGAGSYSTGGISSTIGSGGGGGGYHGGGGGAYGGGGGGGSSWTNSTYATAVTHTQGYNCGSNGIVIITVANCTGTPTAGTITASVSTGCGSYTSVLTLTGATSSGSITYQWQSSTDGITWTNITGATTTTYTATVTANTYYRCVVTCTTSGLSSTTSSLELLYNPIPSGITGSTTVCVGSTVTLSDVTTGGTWTSSSSNATVGSTTGIVTGVTAGTATITYTITSTGCYVTYPITVNAAPTAIMGTTTVCVGGTSTLSDAISGGTWSSVSTGVATIGSTTGLLSGISAGTSIISYILSSGCYATTTATVNPGAGTITGPTTVCETSTISLTDVTTGGTWSSSSSNATVGSTTGIVTGVTAGTATITYTITSTGCYVSIPVTVNATPTAILGTTTVCLGGTSTLSDAIGGGTWSSVTTGVAGIGSATGVMTGAGAGTSVISYILSDGCYTTTTATVNPGAGTITGADSVCTGSTILLSDVISAGTWSVTGGASIVGTSGVLTGVSAGTATVTYTITSTGCYTTYLVTVNSTPPAITGSHTVCVGGTTILSNTMAGGNWTSSTPGTASIDATGTVSGVVAGTATISYTMPTGGCYTTFTETVNPLPAAISGTDSVCVNATVTLSDATGGGTWSTTSGTATVVSGTGVVTGTSAGMATITYTLGTSCYETFTMTVNAIPAPITGVANVCALEGTTTLADITGGGIWTSSNTAIATVGATGIVSGITAGTDSIYYTLPTTGCFVYQAVVVNPLPAAITGIDSVCVASTVTLSDVTGGGTWSTVSGTASVGAGTGVVTGTGAGGATITYSLGTGCYVTYDMTVNPLPAAMVASSLSICSGLTADFTDITTSGLWSSSVPGVAAIGSVSGIALGAAAGTTTISYILPTGCYVTNSLVVHPLPAAIAGTDSVCVGSAITLSDATAGGTWSESSAGAIANIGAGTGILNGISQGIDTVTYTLTATGCLMTMSVNVHPLPAAILGVTTICSGLSTTLSDITPGGTWSSSAPGTAAVSATGVVTGGTAGTATISYTLPTGCYSTALVTVNGLPSAISGPSAVCVGSTINLTESTGGGTWSEASGGLIATIGAGTGVVTGMFAGTDTITYTITATGCLMTDIIVVNPLPAAINGATDVCVGSTITLSDITGGGHWTSSNTAWATATLTTGVITGVAAGTPTISYTLVATGCYATYPITVNPLPTAILGATDVCEGGSTITLSDMTGGGIWISSAPAIATIGSSSGVVTGVMAGTTTITYMLTATTCQITSVVTVHPLPAAIGGPSVVCENATITLFDGSGGGTWTSTPTTIATVGLGTGVVFGVSAGTATVTYTITLTGCSITTPITVNPQPPAIITPIGDTMMCPGGFVDLTCGTGTGLSYQWYNSGAAIGGATASSYLTAGAGIYSVQVTNSFGCVKTSNGMNVSINPATAAITIATSTTFCSGTTDTLRANTGVGLTYQWQLGGISIPGATSSVYAAALAGDYTAIVTNSAGCYAVSNTITLNTIVAPGAAITTSGALTFCLGDSVRMQGDTVSSYTYQWQLGGTNIFGATNTSYTATTAGNYTLIESNTYGCSTTSATQTVVVNPLPSSVITAATSTTFCAGGSVVLSAAAVAGYNYQWYKNGALITGASTANYTATTAGIYKVQVTNGTTGCSSISSTPDTVVVIATPVITALSATSFCWGSSALLSVATGGAMGISYQWQLGGVSIPGATNGTYSAVVSGSYTCQITLASGCSSTSVATMVTEYPLPNPIITWDGIRLHAGTHYTSYQWYENTVLLIGATDSTLIPTGNGHFAVGVTDSNGCQSISDIYLLSTYTGLGHTQVGTVTAASQIHIYPNPTHGNVIISAPVKVNATLSSIDGRKQMDISDATQIDISMLADGIYLISIYDQEGTLLKIEKLVKTSN